MPPADGATPAAKKPTDLNKRSLFSSVFDFRKKIKQRLLPPPPLSCQTLLFEPRALERQFIRFKIVVHNRESKFRDLFRVTIQRKGDDGALASSPFAGAPASLWDTGECGAKPSPQCIIALSDNMDATYAVGFVLEDPGQYVVSIFTEEKQHIKSSPMDLEVFSGNSEEMLGEWSKELAKRSLTNEKYVAVRAHAGENKQKQLATSPRLAAYTDGSRSKVQMAQEAASEMVSRVRKASRSKLLETTSQERQLRRFRSMVELQQSSATKIQAELRGYNVRKTKLDRLKEIAASKIQNAYRNRNACSAGREIMISIYQTKAEERRVAAVVMIQKTYRGLLIRRRITKELRRIRYLKESEDRQKAHVSKSEKRRSIYVSVEASPTSIEDAKQRRASSLALREKESVHSVTSPLNSAFPRLLI